MKPDHDPGNARDRDRRVIVPRLKQYCPSSSAEARHFRICDFMRGAPLGFYGGVS
jgi:hypothetical protein